MIHSSRGKPCKKDTGEIRGYPYKDEYKYLGIIIDKNLTLKKQLMYLKNKVKRGMKMIYMTG